MKAKGEGQRSDLRWVISHDRGEETIGQDGVGSSQ